MTAAALVSQLPHACTVRLIESAEIGTVGVGEGTIPPFLGFNHQLGLDEAEYLRATHATYKLGIEFVGWAEEGQRYFHQFGEIGRPLNGLSFHQIWLKYRDRVSVGPLDALRITTLRLRHAEQVETVVDRALAIAKSEPAEEPISSALKIDDLKIELGYALLPLVNSADGTDRLTEQIKALRRSLAGDAAARALQ